MSRGGPQEVCKPPCAVAPPSRAEFGRSESGKATLAGVWALVIGGHVLALWGWQWMSKARVSAPEVVWLQMTPPEPEPPAAKRPPSVPPALSPPAVVRAPLGRAPEPAPALSSAAVASPSVPGVAATGVSVPSASAPGPLPAASAEPRGTQAGPATAAQGEAVAPRPGGAGGDAMTLPNLSASYLNNPPPVYPPISKRMGEQGRVVMRVLIDEQGLPQKAELMAGSGYSRLDQAAEKAVMSWRYVPGQRGGRPQAMWFNVPISFELKPTLD